MRVYMFVNVLLPVHRTAALSIFAVAAVLVIALDSPRCVCAANKNRHHLQRTLGCTLAVYSQQKPASPVFVGCTICQVRWTVFIITSTLSWNSTKGKISGFAAPNQHIGVDLRCGWCANDWFHITLIRRVFYRFININFFRAHFSFKPFITPG